MINILEKPYSVDDLVVPDEFNAIIAATLKEIDLLAGRIDPTLYKTMTVFVDPIDGTREFATAQVHADLSGITAYHGVAATLLLEIAVSCSLLTARCSLSSFLVA